MAYDMRVRAARGAVATQSEPKRSARRRTEEMRAETMTRPRPRVESAASVKDGRPAAVPSPADVLEAIRGYAIITLDRDGIVTTWPEGAAQLTGHAGGEVCGRPFAMFGTQSAVAEVDRMLRAATDNGVFRQQRWWRRRDGGLAHIDEEIRPFGNTGYIVVARDLAVQSRVVDGERSPADRTRAGLQGGERHASFPERHAAFLAEATSILVATSLDTDSMLRAVARLAVSRLSSWCAIHAMDGTGAIERAEVAHRDAKLERALRRVIRDGLNDRWRETVREVVRTGQSHMQSDLRSDSWFRDGIIDDHALDRIATGSAMVTPLIGHGLVLGVITFVSTDPDHEYGENDLTLAEEFARRAAIALHNARLYREAQEANRAKADFLAIVSHELRTPLNAIMGYTDLLDAGVSGEMSGTQHQQLDRIRVSAQHLLQLIDEILSFARMETGHEEAKLGPVTASDIVNGAAAVIEPIAAAKDLEFRIDMPGDVTLETDADKARQILVNVLSNSVKFTDKGTVTLRVRHNKEFAHFDVIDTGIGIPQEQMDRIFDPFWQAERPNVRRAGGTGLGLSVSRRFVSMLNGEIAVESEPGRGTCITVSLPLRRTAAAGG